MPLLEFINSIYAKYLLNIFGNVCIDYCLLCTILVTVVTIVKAERSISKLGNSLKTSQRSTADRKRLN